MTFNPPKHVFFIFSWRWVSRLCLARVRHYFFFCSGRQLSRCKHSTTQHCNCQFFWQLHAYKPPQLSQSKAVIFRQDVPHAQFDSIIQVWGVLFLFGLLVLLLFLLMFLLLFLSFFVLLVLLVLLVLVVIVLVLSFSLWEPIVKRPAKGVRSRHGLIHTKHHAQVHKFNMSDANMQQQVWDRKQSHFPRHFIMRCARYKFPRFKPVISMPSSMMPSSTEKGSLFSSSSSKPQRKTRDGFTMLGGKGSRASTAIWSDGIQGPNTSRICFFLPGLIDAPFDTSGRHHCTMALSSW